MLSQIRQFLKGARALKHKAVRIEKLHYFLSEPELQEQADELTDRARSLVERTRKRFWTLAGHNDETKLTDVERDILWSIELTDKWINRAAEVEREVERAIDISVNTLKLVYKDYDRMVSWDRHRANLRRKLLRYYDSERNKSFIAEWKAKEEELDDRQTKSDLVAQLKMTLSTKYTADQWSTNMNCSSNLADAIERLKWVTRVSNCVEGLYPSTVPAKLRRRSLFQPMGLAFKRAYHYLTKAEELLTKVKALVKSLPGRLEDPVTDASFLYQENPFNRRFGLDLPKLTC